MAENDIHTYLNGLLDNHHLPNNGNLVNLSACWNGKYNLPESGWNIVGLSETKTNLDPTTPIIARLLYHYDPSYEVILSAGTNMILRAINPFYLHMNAGPKDKDGNKIGRSDGDILQKLFVRSKVIGRELLTGMRDDSSFQDLLKILPQYAMELHILREQYTPQLDLGGEAGFVFNMSLQQKFAYVSPRLIKKETTDSQ
ncbi:MAG: hypothetical protein Q7S61_05275 [bacterium]|nr:hypothetical protein [bacterium]